MIKIHDEMSILFKIPVMTHTDGKQEKRLYICMGKNIHQAMAVAGKRAKREFPEATDIEIFQTLAEVV